MKRVLKIVIAVAAVGAIVTAGVYGHRYVQQRSKPAESPAETQAASVRVAAVRADAVEEALTLTGEVMAIATVEVTPKIAGRLERLALASGAAVTEGTAVAKGEVIAVLEHKDLEARAAQAAAAVKTAEAAVATAGAAVEAAGAGVAAADVALADKKREKERMARLHEQGSATERQRDQAETQHDQAVADGRRAAAELTAARARLAQARAAQAQADAAARLADVTLQEAFLKSPLTGVVCLKHVDPGAMVGPATPIVRVQAMDELKVLVAVPGSALPKIVPDTTAVTVCADAYPDRQFACRISKVYPTVDAATRTATVEIRIRNERNDRGEHLLRPGLYVTARIVVQRKDRVVVVPADVLIRRLGKYYAFVVEGGLARRRLVTLGLRSGERVEIVGGLSLGEGVVVSGQHRLTDGSPVKRVRAGQGEGARP